MLCYHIQGKTTHSFYGRKLLELMIIFLVQKYMVIKSVTEERIIVNYLISCDYFIHFYESDAESKYVDDYDSYTSDWHGF